MIVLMLHGLLPVVVLIDLVDLRPPPPLLLLQLLLLLRDPALLLPRSPPSRNDHKHLEHFLKGSAFKSNIFLFETKLHLKRGVEDGTSESKRRQQPERPSCADERPGMSGWSQFAFAGTKISLMSSWETVRLGS